MRFAVGTSGRRSPALAQRAAIARRQVLRRLFASSCAALMLYGCGGGGDNAGGPGASAPEVPVTLTLLVTAVDTQGQPMAGALIRWPMSSAQEALTASDGTATLQTRGLPIGPSISVSKEGYWTYGRTLPAVPVGSQVTEQVTLISTDEVRLTLAGVTADVSADASSAVITAEVDLLDHNSVVGPLLNTNVTVAERGTCNEWGTACLLDEAGLVLQNTWWQLASNVPTDIAASPTGVSNRYQLRFVVQSDPGTLTAGRIVPTGVVLRVMDSSVWMEFNVRL